MKKKIFLFSILPLLSISILEFLSTFFTKQVKVPENNNLYSQNISFSNNSLSNEENTKEYIAEYCKNFSTDLMTNKKTIDDLINLSKENNFDIDDFLLLKENNFNFRRNLW